ncbi:MAG TPA: hypothetical protein VEJ43_04385 [Pseudolabrys sp.]|nr:hypothetical protein [Pseudolabrys sp.]
MKQGLGLRETLGLNFLSDKQLQFKTYKDGEWEAATFSPSTVLPILTDSSVCLVQSGLRKPAGLSHLVTRFYSGSFGSGLRSMYGDGAAITLDFPSIICGYRMENFPWHNVFLS